MKRNGRRGEIPVDDPKKITDLGRSVPEAPRQPCQSQGALRSLLHPTGDTWSQTRNSATRRHRHTGTAPEIRGGVKRKRRHQIGNCD